LKIKNQLRLHQAFVKKKINITSKLLNEENNKIILETKKIIIKSMKKKNVRTKRGKKIRM
jgi:hypothetical protein